MKPKRPHIRKAVKAPVRHRGQQPPRPSSQPIDFKALEWADINGQPVVWVLCDRPRPRDGSDLVGKIVSIDGLLCRCKAVHIIMRVSTPERMKAELKLPLRVGEKIGLVVSGVN